MVAPARERGLKFCLGLQVHEQDLSLPRGSVD